MMDDKKLNDSELENVSGGFIFNATNISGSDPMRPWEVIDNKNGNVLNRFGTKAEAEACARSYGSLTYNAMEINWNDVCSLRSNPIA
ncbi:MAG: hypothetical protein J5367_05900 [Lachnospiraceae bacterium]|nr:hypothetical protein [Lachnospiraceae bacterium]